MRGVEVQGQRFFEVVQRFVFRCPLTGDVDFKALRDVPIALSPNSRGKRSLHAPILSHPCEKKSVRRFRFGRKVGAARARHCERRSDAIAHAAGPRRRDMLGVGVGGTGI